MNLSLRFFSLQELINFSIFAEYNRLNYGKEDY